MQAQSILAAETRLGDGIVDSVAPTSAAITIEDDGCIVALARLGANDTDSAAAVAAVIAEELRLSTDRVRVEPAERGATVAAPPPLSSAVNLRSTAIAVRAYLLDRASSYFHMDASELLLNDGRVMTFDGRAMTYQDLNRAESGVVHA